MNNLILREKCPVCNSMDSKTIFSRSFNERLIKKYMNIGYHGNADITFLKDENYTIVKCRKCKLAYQENVLPEDKLNELYNEWIDPLLAQEWKERKKAQKRIHYSRVLNVAKRQIKKKIKEINVLDFGAGFGELLLVATEMGFNSFAYEYSTERIDFLERKGINVIGDSNKMLFDIIICDQILEHVTSPSEILNTISLFLNNNGVIYVSVPNCFHIERMLKKAKDVTDEKELHRLLLNASVAAFQHINFFRHSNLIMLLRMHNLININPIKQISKPLSINSFLRPFYKHFFGTGFFLKVDENGTAINNV